MTHVAPYRPPPWMPGQDVAMCLIVRCPVCGGYDYQMTHKKGRARRHMRCNDCDHKWVRFHDGGVRRVLLAAIV